MAELKLNNAETAALERIDAELTGFSTRSRTMAVAGGGEGDLCEKYRAIRAALLILIKIVKKIPGIGSKIAAALEFLMSLADAFCPA